MNKQQAKQHICSIAADIVSCLDEPLLFADTGESHTDEDTARLRQARDELVRELKRRSKPVQKKTHEDED